MNKSNMLISIVLLSVTVLFAGILLAGTKDGALDIYRQWLQCVAEKGENHEDCQKLFQDFLATAYKRLEELKAEYQKKCGDSEKAQSEYCKKLAKQIEELEKAIENVTQRKMAKATSDRIAKLALECKWDDVYDALSFKGKEQRSIVDDLLLGYACLYRKDWQGAWNSFSAVDTRKDKQMLLDFSKDIYSQSPNSAMAFVLKGDILARMGRYDEAVSALDHAISLDSKATLAYEVRALVKSLGCHYDEAVNDLSKAVKLSPAIANAMYERSVIDLVVGDFEEAAVGLTRLLEKEPHFFLAKNARGVAYLLLAQYDKALQDFDSVIGECPSFAEAASNKQLAIMLRAKGLFAVDMKKLASLSPKGILGAKVSTDFYYAGAGINSPDGGQTLLLAKQRAGSDAMVLTIREHDYIAKGLTPGNPALGRSIAQEVAMSALEAKNAGKNLIVSVVPNLENYKGQLVTEYMFDKKQWEASRPFCAVAMDSSLSGYRSVVKDGFANGILHSFHGDAVPLTKGGCYDQLDLFKIRTGGGTDDGLANRLQEYKTAGKSVNLFTGRGDAPSLWNAATKSTADRFADAGLVTSYFDKMNHGHGIPLSSSLYEVRTQSGTTSLIGDLSTLTRRDVCQGLSKDGSRSGVFMMLGPNDMDVKKVDKDDLGFIFGSQKQSHANSVSNEEEPDLAYPFLLFNPQESMGSVSAGGAK